MIRRGMMYLIDTNVLSEVRKKSKANAGVIWLFRSTVANEKPLYFSVITLGELRRGVALIRHRGDKRQATQLDQWLQLIITQYQDHILDLNSDVAQLWGHLRSPHHEHAIDKQIAATALIYGLTLVTRNTKDFNRTGVSLLNPFD